MLLAAERAGHTLGRVLGKSLAVAGFLGVAWSGGVPTTDAHRALFCGLHLAALGDLLLLPRGKGPAFLGGLVAFLLGHVAYVVALVVGGLDLRAALGAAVALALPAFIVVRWLAPRAGRLARPVVAYVVVISSMVTAAIAHAAYAPDTRGLALLGAAVAFYVSDLGVARERFVAAGFVNKLVGQPLYFGAQLVFAAVAAGHVA